MKKLNLVGQKFNRLTVIKFAYIKNKRTAWLCKCDCGNFTIVVNSSLKNGDTKSCGCLKRDKTIEKNILSAKHSMSYTKFYGVWHRMKQRCLNKKKDNYKNYGGRGITVCERWLKFENFRDDMYLSYKEHKLNNKYTSLDRMNNNENYCKENCRWATCKEQQNNTRYNYLLTYKRQTLNITQWAKKLNINRNVLYSRIRNK